VLAANAWMAHLPGLREDTVVVSSDVVATAPAPELLAELGWRGDEGAFDARLMVNYWRATPDGRIVFGRGGGTHAFAARIGGAFERSERQRPTVERDLRKLLPRFREVPVTHSWAGAVERTSDGLVRFGRLGGDERLIYAIGYSGSGVVPAVTVGRCLASTALGRHDEWAQLAQLLSRQAPPLPPEPLRYVGGLLVRRAVERKESIEDAGGKPSVIVRRLASLAPGGVAVAPRGRQMS
jgi:glycine/D-amino acid oxidase-like deaminating enzyme